jgi:hypothetical protein
MEKYYSHFYGGVTPRFFLSKEKYTIFCASRENFLFCYIFFIISLIRVIMCNARIMTLVFFLISLIRVVICNARIMTLVFFLISLIRVVMYNARIMTLIVFLISLIRVVMCNARIMTLIFFLSLTLSSCPVGQNGRSGARFD